MKLTRIFIATVFLLGVASSPFLIRNISFAQSSGAEQRDCDSNAVIRCGVGSPSELNNKYDSQSNVKHVFTHFGISSAEINSLGSNYKTGYVTKDGRVIVDGKTVATNAMTAGRQNMAGSTKVTKSGTTLYTRPPSVSFTQDRLNAYVVMKDGSFQFAVLTSCGNPVKATPVAKEAPPKAKAPQPAPPITPAKVESSASCRLLQVEIREDRQVNAKLFADTENATVIRYRIDFGDGTVSDNQNVTNKYQADGTYTITGTVTVKHADGREETITSETCKQQITIITPVTPAITPPTPITPAGKETPAPPPEVLPETGASTGEIVGASAAIAAGGTVGHLFYTRQRNKFI